MPPSKAPRKYKAFLTKAPQPAAPTPLNSKTGIKKSLAGGHRAGGDPHSAEDRAFAASWGSGAVHSPPLPPKAKGTRHWKTAAPAALSAASLSPAATAPDLPAGGTGRSRSLRRRRAHEQQPFSSEPSSRAGGSDSSCKLLAQGEEQPTRRRAAYEQQHIKLTKKQKVAKPLPRPPKRVRFAQGPLAAPAAGADGHPTQEGRVARPVRYLDSPFARGKNVTKKDVRELEEWLEGPEYEPSLTKLKMRVGLLPAVPLVRPHATATRQRGRGS